MKVMKKSSLTYCKSKKRELVYCTQTINSQRLNALDGFQSQQLA